MLFLDYTQVQYCKVQARDETISGVIYNNNLFIRQKAFPKEEMEAAIKECREEYLDHGERSQIPTLLIEGRKSVGIWMQNNKHKANIIAIENNSSDAAVPNLSTKKSGSTNRINLKELVEEMRSEQGVEIKTRRYKLKLFQHCF